MKRVRVGDVVQFFECDALSWSEYDGDQAHPKKMWGPYPGIVSSVEYGYAVIVNLAREKGEDRKKTGIYMENPSYEAMRESRQECVWRWVDDDDSEPGPMVTSISYR